MRASRVRISWTERSTAVGRIGALARRFVASLAPLAVLSPLVMPANAALAQAAGGYTDPYVANHRNIVVTDDAVELSIVAESFDLAFRRQEATLLREFVERRLWLSALGEPQPVVANVGDVLDARWPELITALRVRGGARTLEVDLVNAEIRQAPTLPDAKPESALEVAVTADIAVTNRGALPVAAVQLAVTVPGEQPGASWFDTCEEHGLDPIEPGETRAVRCGWQGTDAHLQTLHRLLMAHERTSPTIAIGDVSFEVAGRRIPHERDVLRNSRSDIDLHRVALERAGPSACNARGDCGAAPTGLAFALLPWLVVPYLLGTAIGRRSSRA